MNIFKRIWNDNVGGKVIAGIILALLGGIYSGIIPTSFWRKKIELWVFLIVLLLLMAILFILIRLKRQKSILKNSPLGQIPFGQSKAAISKHSETIGKIYFNSKRADKSQFKAILEFMYENEKPKGDKGQGKIEFEKELLNIERYNRDGRILIKISKYYSEGVVTEFIKRNLALTAIRVIKITFQAKIMSGYHSLFFVAKKPNSNQWFHNAFVKVTIRN